MNDCGGCGRETLICRIVLLVCWDEEFNTGLATVTSAKWAAVSFFWQCRLICYLEIVSIVRKNLRKLGEDKNILICSKTKCLVGDKASRQGSHEIIKCWITKGADKRFFFRWRYDGDKLLAVEWLKQNEKKIKRKKRGLLLWCRHDCRSESERLGNAHHARLSKLTVGR